MQSKELNHFQCKCYLVACEQTRRALIIDPERTHVDRYIGMLAYDGLQLQAIVDTHTHADHLSGSDLLHALTGAPVMMHDSAPSPRVARHVRDGDVIEVGRGSLKVLHTPGHTPDSVSLFGDGRVFTGDVLLIGGTGRADFAGGDAGQQYDSITQKLFALPDETLVFPAHDYRGNTVSTIGDEKRHNPRLGGRSRREYIDLMASIEFPLLDKIQEVLQPNQTAIDDDEMKFPSLAQLNEVRQLNPRDVHANRESKAPPVLVDVREADEFHGDLGHIPGSQLIPLKDLPAHIEELRPHAADHIVLVCRSGVRSTTAAAILTAMGFSEVSNLKGGMLAWNQLKLPVER